MPDTASTLPPPPPPLPIRKSIFHKAATFCVWSPLLAIAVNMMGPTGHGREEVIIRAVAAAAVPLAGIVAGLVALFGIRKYGRKGILWKSVAGLVIWALLAVAAVPVFLAVRDQALKLREQRTGTPAP